MYVYNGKWLQYINDSISTILYYLSNYLFIIQAYIYKHIYIYAYVMHIYNNYLQEYIYTYICT